MYIAQGQGQITPVGTKKNFETKTFHYFYYTLQISAISL